MRIIGITGKAGTGKTTLSNMLIKNDDIKVIHIDYLMDKVKENKFLKNITTEAKQVEGQEHSYRLMNQGLSDFIYNNKIILMFYLKIKNKIKSKRLEDTIKEFEDNNTETLIIEGFDLLNFNVAKKLDLLVLLKVPYYERINRLSRRDGIVNKKEVITIDKKLQKNLKKIRNIKIDYTIENNGDVKYLEEQSKIILKSLKEKNMSPEERFRKKRRLLNFKSRAITEHNVGEYKKGIIKKYDKEIYED